MAAKRLLEKPPPTYSSSSSSEDDSSSDADSDQQNTVALPHTNFPPMKPSPDSDSESDSSSDSDSDSKITNPKSPISSVQAKPADETKRKTLADDEEKTAKKKRKVSAPTSNGGAEDPKSPSSFNRFWSEEDEIAILKGISEFKDEKGSDPKSDMAGFHDFIRKSLHVEASKAQLADKIRRLKNKFLINAEKDEAAISAGKPHEIRSFELSKKLWAAGKAKQKRTSAKSKKVTDNGVDESGDFWSKFPWLGNSMGLFEHSLGKMMEKWLPKIEGSKAKELDEKWKKLMTEEMKVKIQRSELVLETNKMVLDCIKSSSMQ